MIEIKIETDISCGLQQVSLLHGMQEVSGSIPLISTSKFNTLDTFYCVYDHAVYDRALSLKPRTFGTNMTEEHQKESEQKDFKESFDAVMKPVVEWLNLKPDDARSARFSFCYSRVDTKVELSQGTSTYNFETIKRH